ncbi:dimethylsulfoniopropionate demethylase [Granulosicoccus antarcticus]|uniref:Dimethylsulfonioproprionate demethylase DmdA n=1 Tax=Granulosicoccus antarcticus IMCC3135 TaxID=1192854 RepID=A0A2Z2NWA3_9GAMM|nr:dimethylsulfoniopropionate demethylase [Granulosicoccus antarcticus]ASJ73090.1 Dimethylsulfonioproprionate demethylase DmdA [Granulosicoccus antarcticus IMCC3135]
MTLPLITFSRRLRETPFTDRILAGGAQSFTVYNHTLLPSWFRSLEGDYWHLVEHVQVWDVSCERQVQLKGPDAEMLVQLMTPRDLSKAQPDQCFYVPICDERGHILNDPIAIKVDDDTWWLSLADSDIYLWAKGLALGKGLDVEIIRADVWPIAVQGPKAETLMARVFGDEVNSIRFFRYKRLEYRGHAFIVARSGWSGQGGFEIYIDDAELGQELWDELFVVGADLNVGHGCPNNIERMETGLLSFGSDMDYSHTPLQCGLDRYCQLDTDLQSMSIAALREQRAQGVPTRLVGIVAPGVPAASKYCQLLADGKPVGDITSQSLSGRYDAWIAFAYFESELIDRLKNESVKLQLLCNNELHDARYSEIPFKLGQMGLNERFPNL